MISHLLDVHLQLCCYRHCICLCTVALQVLVVSISGAAGLNGITQPLLLTATVGDPNNDDPKISALPIEYDWGCQLEDGSDCVFNDLGDGKIEVSTDELVEGTYFFYVYVTKGTRFAFAEATAAVNSKLDVEFEIVLHTHTLTHHDIPFLTSFLSRQITGLSAGNPASIVLDPSIEFLIVPTVTIANSSSVTYTYYYELTDSTGHDVNINDAELFGMLETETPDVFAVDVYPDSLVGPQTYTFTLWLVPSDDTYPSALTTSLCIVFDLLVAFSHPHIQLSCCLCLCQSRQ